MKSLLITACITIVVLVYCADSQAAAQTSARTRSTRPATVLDRVPKQRKLRLSQYPLNEASSNAGHAAQLKAGHPSLASLGPSYVPLETRPGVFTESSSSSGSDSESGINVLMSSPAQSNLMFDDLETIYERRQTSIVASIANTAKQNAIRWLLTLGADGKWPNSEIDYTAGCNARRANWPAQKHWQRLVAIASVWYADCDDADACLGPDLYESISRAMKYWFANDFINPTCLDSGSSLDCPCDTPGFWNTNWFSNIILIPRLVGETCLLLGDSLDDILLTGCTRIMSRAYGTFDRRINGLGYLTGANTLDVAKIGIDEALLTRNVTLLSDAYRRIHSEVVIQDAVMADGIRRDGSFGQHGGIIYNGNYGKDYLNDILGVEIDAGGTRYAAGSTVQSAFTALIDGIQWMIYRNVLTSVLHWDFSVLGRMISWPVADKQATGSMKINITDIGRLGQLWNSGDLLSAYDNLLRATQDANVGDLNGNRMFYNNDYMVHRGRGYVSTLRMYSNRTRNTECVNSQNLLGFHLADGVQYTYLRGDEYEDTAAAWDWNLIPGVTVDYRATPLDCSHTQYKGFEAFVGGASDGRIGVAAMRYTNPYTKALRWQKVWFFLEGDVQHVMVPSYSSSSDAPIFSVLDQKRRRGDVLVNGIRLQESTNITGAHTLWHDRVGYLFSSHSAGLPYQLSVRMGNRTGSWSSIGTSTAGDATVDLFAAWINHGSAPSPDPLSYTVFPSTGYAKFERKSLATRLKTVRNDDDTSAVYDEVHRIFMAVFWNPEGGSVQFSPSPYDAQIVITASGNVAVIYRRDEGILTIADPSQTLENVQLGITIVTRAIGGLDNLEEVVDVKELLVQLPTGGLAGSSVSVQVR
ncbi:galactose mutarotase-like protein [Obba rivulosa]|uniref:Galactose mutarotase-like protein n=1 Tax=Obba rivulosa TaxID=1052685 RepID=A0A8E2DUU2_9APHY|nr:galactose mutarotase-like protein [Obba rivulosa]